MLTDISFILNITNKYIFPIAIDPFRGQSCDSLQARSLCDINWVCPLCGMDNKAKAKSCVLA